MRALVVAKDEWLQNELRETLSVQNLSVDLAMSHSEAQKCADEGSYAVILAEHEPEDGGATGLIARLRSANVGSPVILLMRDGSPQAQIDALDRGADDVLPIPFDRDLLLAHVRSLIRRCEPGESAVLKYEDLSFDLRSLRIVRQDTPVSCTSREMAVLEHLMRNADRVVTRSELIDVAWDASVPPDSNVVEVFIARLRRKLDKPFGTPLIHTIIGRGYMLSVTAPNPARGDAGASG